MPTRDEVVASEWTLLKVGRELERWKRVRAVWKKRVMPGQQTMWQWIGAPRRAEADGAKSAAIDAVAKGDRDVTDLTLDATTAAEVASESRELLAAWAADEGLQHGEEREDEKSEASCVGEKESSDDLRYDASTDEEAATPKAGYCRGTLAGWIVGRRRTRRPRGQHERGQRSGAAARKQRGGHETTWRETPQQGDAQVGSGSEAGATAADEGGESEAIEWRYDPVMCRGRWHVRQGTGASGGEAATAEDAAAPPALAAGAQGTQSERCPHRGVAPQMEGDDDAARAHAPVRDERGQTSEGSPSPSRGKRKQPPGSSRDAGGAEGGESLREPD